jgi:DNA-binding SARP family transcriptional activator
LAKTGKIPFAIGISTILQSVYHIEQGELKKATKSLDGLAEINIPQHSGYIHFLHNLLRAECALAQDQIEEMVVHLEAAFSDAAENGLMMAMGLNRQRLSRLCAEALRADIHPRIVTELINRMKLLPPLSHTLTSDCWPWPIKLCTLGKLDIHCEDKRLTLSAKTPKKTLELLKLLVCKQGQETARDAVIDQLWPDTDGDRAIQNFDTTLHRLRKLLGRNEAVSIEAGRLTLNPTLCWVDAWHFETLMDQAKSISNPTKQIELLTGCIALYSGPFDGLHDENTWGVGYAERLKARWIDAVVTLGKQLNESEQIEQAEDLFQQALALDDTVEPFYRELMTALSAQGRTAEALLTFNRYCSVLATQELEPSADIMALHHELQDHRTASKQKRG